MMSSQQRINLIVSQFVAGATMREIGERLGITKQAIWNAINKRNDRKQLYGLRAKAKRELRLQRAYRNCKLPSCGKGFYDLNGGKLYCSSKCRFKYKREKANG